MLVAPAVSPAMAVMSSVDASWLSLGSRLANTPITRQQLLTSPSQNPKSAARSAPVP